MAENKKYVELLWAEKYDKFDKGEKIPIEKPNLPFQVVETINKPRIKGGITTTLFPEDEWPEDYPKDWKNLLIWGDNKLVMSSLIKHGWAGKINLIYIDPPFFTGADFSIRTKIGDEKIEKAPTIIEERAYNDTWSGGIASYLRYMYERLLLMRELLSENGSIYVHLDWHVGHYVKVMMDEIFGPGGEPNTPGFKNDIVWCYKTRQFSKKYWNRKHDIILFYTKSGNYTFNWQKVLTPLSESTIKKYRLVDEEGQRYRLVGRGITDSPIRSAKDVDPKWEKTHPELVVRDYLREGYAPEDWWIIDIVNQAAIERLAFDTQKPEALLNRVILASSNPGDIVADFFCGSGTTLATAEKLGRRWLGCDLSKFAIQVTRKRLLDIHNSKDVQEEEK